MKRIILSSFILMSVALNAQTTTVSGVITYQFNSNPGNRPDLGAEVYLIDSTRLSGKIDFLALDTFQKVKFFEETQRSYERLSMQYEDLALELKNNTKYKVMYEERVKSAIEKKREAGVWKDSVNAYGANGELGLPDRNVRVNQMLLLLNNNNTIKRTVDGNGNYSIITSPGTYYVFIKSKNRTAASSVLESTGKVYFKKVTIKEGQRKDVSHNFEFY